MNRRFLRLTFLLGSFLCFLYFIYGIKGQRLSAYILEETKYDMLISERKETKRDFIKGISFDGQELIKDIDTDIWYYSLNEGRLSAYNPSVKLNMSDSNVRFAIRENHITSAFIKENYTMELVAYTDNVYKRYYLKVTLLPIMEITCPAEAPEFDTEMTMHLYDNCANEVHRVSAAEGKMHIRGGTSINYPKKGYKLSFENPKKLSLLGMRRDDDWILYAAYNDQERVRNVFSTKLWREACAGNNEFGIDNGVEYKFIELFLNGRYHGLYALGYPVDSKVLDISDEEYTYKKKYWDAEANTDFSKAGAMSGYELEERHENIISAWSPLRDYYELLYLPEQAEDSELLSTVDIKNSIDTYIFLNLIQGTDHVNKYSIHNVYITAKLMTDDYVMLYTPWDMDQSWGNVWSDDEPNWCNAYGITPQDNYVLNNGVVAELVNRGNEEITAAVAERYKELRKDEWSNKNINRLLDKYETDVYKSGAYLRDMERWQDATNQNPEDGLNLFREYVLERFQYVDQYYEESVR